MIRIELKALRETVHLFDLTVLPDGRVQVQDSAGGPVHVLSDGDTFTLSLEQQP